MINNILDAAPISRRQRIRHQIVRLKTSGSQKMKIVGPKIKRVVIVTKDKVTFIIKVVAIASAIRFGSKALLASAHYNVFSIFPLITARSMRRPGIGGKIETSSNEVNSYSKTERNLTPTEIVQVIGSQNQIQGVISEVEKPVLDEGSKENLNEEVVNGSNKMKKIIKERQRIHTLRDLKPESVDSSDSDDEDPGESSYYRNPIRIPVR